MSTPSCNPPARAARPIEQRALALLLTLLTLLTLLAAPLAQALSTDRDQPMDIRADHQKTAIGEQTQLNGNVVMVQGSLKATGANATVYQHPSNARDARGNDIGGSVRRIVLTGQRAHLEERQDGGGLVTADARKIDYNVDTSIAELTGDVRVLQQGRGEFYGEHMTYNTVTGEIESGGTTPGNRVHMIIQPRAKGAGAAADKPAAPAPATPAGNDPDAAAPSPEPATEPPSGGAGAAR
jgi:lipopolysaccharide export system protein LptA